MKMSLSTIREVKLEEYGDLNYLAIETSDKFFSQNYPAFNVEKQYYNTQLDYICQFLGIETTLSDRRIFIGKKEIYKFTDKGMIELLYNPENNQFFSLQMKYTINNEKYQNIIAEFKEKNNHINNLSDYEMLIFGYVKASVSEKKEEEKYLNDLISDIDKRILNEKLNSELSISPKKGITKI